MLSDVGYRVEGVLLDWHEAITFTGGPLLVAGGAGTGKTSLLEARFCWLVSEGGLTPERVAVVLPSVSRARAMRRRLEERLDQGYEQLFVLTPVDLAAVILAQGGLDDALDGGLAAGDRLALLLERIDELPLSHHDFGGSATSLLGSFVRRIDRLKSEMVSAEEYRSWADRNGGGPEREFAEIYLTHERLLADLGVRDAGNLLLDALRMAQIRQSPFAHVIIDDAQELDLAAFRLVRAVAGSSWTAAGDARTALSRFRGAGAERLGDFDGPEVRVVRLERSLRSPERVALAARAVLGSSGDQPGVTSGVASEVAPSAAGEIAFWRCANERAQAQAVAVEIERLIARDGVSPEEILVIVPAAAVEGRTVAVALEERAVPHRLVGEAAFLQRAEIRDVLAWLRLLADPSDAGAVVRALARPPIDLRSVDIARCTQIARRRKLDMVGALAAALESPQVPPEARERIRGFLKLYRAGVTAIDTTRPDLYVHRLIERLGLRRQQLFAAQADVVERLRALARFGELAAAYVRRAPQATPREFARSISAVAEFGLSEQEEPAVVGATGVQVVGMEAVGGLSAEHVYVLGLHAGVSFDGGAIDVIPDALLHEELPADDEQLRRARLRQFLYAAVTRSAGHLVLSYPIVGGVDAVRVGGGLSQGPSSVVEEARIALGSEWEDREEELFGPAETLHSTYRLLRDELLESTMRAGGRLGELRFDTDLDISHAVVRYLELLKLAALIARPEGQGLAEALRDVNARILQAVSAEQREIFGSSALDDYLLDAERDARRRTAAVAARDEPSLEAFLPLRGEGVVLSASDIDTYRTCPLKYKFARIFRIPQEPTVHQRFGILVHQVLERFHARVPSEEGATGSLAELLGLLDARWRRGGFGDSEEERQLRAKAAASLSRYWERFQSEESEPVWFERQFTFKLGPHLLRGRVDRVDRLPDGDYELIDYKTGRPKTATQLADDVQLSLYAVGAREAWSLDSSQQAYYYLLDDQKVTVPVGSGGDRGDWIREVAVEVAEGILSQGFEPTPSFAACSVCDYRLVCPAAER